MKETKHTLDQTDQQVTQDVDVQTICITHGKQCSLQLFITCKSFYILEPSWSKYLRSFHVQLEVELMDQTDLVKQDIMCSIKNGQT